MALNDRMTVQQNNRQTDKIKTKKKNTVPYTDYIQLCASFADGGKIDCKLFACTDSS